MSEFMHLRPEGEKSEPAHEQEAQGLTLADEINQLRAAAKTKEDYDAITQKIRSLKLIFEPHIESGVEQAVEILGSSNVLGPEAVKKAFGVELSTELVPTIPFSTVELERARDLGQMLVLRVATGPDGAPLTMQKINEQLEAILTRDGKGKVLYDTDWYGGEEFFTAEAPELAWALVGKEVIPDSTSKNYLEQTAKLASYIEKEVFKDAPLPPEWEEALNEFIGERGKIEPLMGDDWAEAARQLSALKLNQLGRHTPVEALYDLMIRFQNSEDRLLEGMYTWTSRLTSDGGLVNLGDFDAGGVCVNGVGPGRSYSALGVSLSRCR